MSPSREPVRTRCVRRLRALARFATVLVGVILAVLQPARPASAHALLRSSDPADGAILTQAPRTARLSFSEDVTAEFRSIRLLDGAGRPVPGAHVAPDLGNPRLLVLELPPLAPGTYGIVWRVMAAADGHSTGGVVVFAVGRRTPAAVAAGGGVADERYADVVRRWLHLCLLAGLVGGLAVAGLTLGAASRTPGGLHAAAVRRARRRLLGFAAACAALGAAVGAFDLVAAAHRAAPAVPDTAPAVMAVRVLTASRWGRLWLAMEAVLVVATILALVLRSRVDRRRGWLLPSATGALVLAAVPVEALGSHAAALDSGRTAGVVADGVHALTACLWLGGVASLALVAWPRTGDGAAVLRTIRGRFTRLAAISVVLVATTGLYSAGREVDSPMALTTTPYGRALLVKSAILLVIGGLGLANAGRLHRRAERGATGPPPSRWLLTLEAGVGSVLLFAVAVLVEAAPPREADSTDTTPLASTGGGRTLSGSTADLIVTVRVGPNRPGANGLTFLVSSTRRPAPAPIDGVAVNVESSGVTSPLPVQQLEPGRYFGTITMEAGGSARITVVIRRAGSRIAVPVDWSVAPAQRAPRTLPVPTRTGP